MMGLDDIAISFAISYIAGSIPTLKDWLSRDKDLEIRLDKCYQKALKKWTVNDGISNSLSNRMFGHLSELKEYLLTKPTDKPKGLDELIAMWADELHNDQQCYSFILENKVDFISSKLDNYYTDLKNSILGQLKTIQEGVEFNGTKLDDISLLLQQISQKQQDGNAEEQIKFVKNLMETTIKDLVNSLHTSTALLILSQLEVIYSAVISKDTTIAIKIEQQKQLCISLMEGKLKIEAVDMEKAEKDMQNIAVPDTLTLENLKNWHNALSLYRIKLGPMVVMSREYVMERPGYKEAFAAANKFYTLLNRTEIVNGFPILRALYCYWGFLVKGDNAWLIEYQNIDKSALGEQKYYFQLIEAAMLFMVDKPEEAFAFAVSIKDGIDASYVDFLILLGYHTKNMDYTIWALNLAIEKQIKVEQYGSKFLAFSVNKDTANQFLAIVPQLQFENEAEKNIVIQLCNSSIGHVIDTSEFKEKTETVSETMLAYAAMLMALNNEVDLAFKLLNPKIEVGKMDLKQRLFIDILCMSVEHKPHLYRLLQQNREQGVTNDEQLLLKEFELAMEVSDFEVALKAISILYSRKPNDEMLFVNYINALSRVCPEELSALQEKVKHFNFTHPDAVMHVYSDYAENNYLEFATEFIVLKQRSMDVEELKHFFYVQCTTGFIQPIVNKEYEHAEEGLSVLYSVGEEKNVVIVKSTTPLGKVLIGKKKGDVLNFQEKELHIEAIFSKFYKESSDYIKEVLCQGGNKFMRMGKIDMEHPLESLEAMLKEIDPECVNYEQRKRDALQKYENDEIGLSQLVDDNHIMGSYYKMLFTPFKIHVIPAYIYDSRCSDIKPNTKFVLDLPACIMLFEFAQKTGCKFRTRFQVSKYLYEFVKQTKRHARRDMNLDFFDGIKSGHVKRFNEYVDVDCEMRLEALIEWIDHSCDIEVTTDALAISKANESQMNALFSNTIVSLMNTDNYLVSDESIYDRLLGNIQMISTEAFIHLKEDKQLAKLYSEFLFECRFEGVYIESDFIINEYFKMEKGEENKFHDVIQNGYRNPYMLINTINAGLKIAQLSLDISLVRITLTNMFAMILKNYNDISFNTEEWQNIDIQLNRPFFNFKLVRECLNDAKMIRKSRLSIE
ncbi:hypothetical protein [Bacteroides sedimenti]|uniref:Uncharacterized protein n=1 Tax=Bacteroides sedimenti TaxID=2136147 RepID=A0ABN6Z4H8_9BACE